MTTARRQARAAAARPPAVAVPESLDWRDPLHGIERWPPGPGNPVRLSVIVQARQQAREARQRAAR